MITPLEGISFSQTTSTSKYQLLEFNNLSGPFTGNAEVSVCRENKPQKKKRRKEEHFDDAVFSIEQK